MAEKLKKEGTVERWSRHLRNLSVLGGVAVLGAGILFPPALAAGETAAGFLALDAGGWEIIHRTAKSRRQKKQK